ncbi:serine hydrolase domain-containing protein [Salimicrobium halophilum]|uniref:CubicO group peptidase, beta-lactamase class C family n=1 Tax=Salimicrobium halophilum TaxID=86666 RepID=A0A1G8RFX6_9BACI|nr:CubicO group peptidase, beta-lactamase class C family [Salimicrobium halophilum]
MKNFLDINQLISDESNHNNFSGAVYVKQDDEVLAELAFGYADRAEKRLNHPTTRFGIASGSKLFTAIGICQLVEEGLITFETHLADALDINFPHFDEDITIHQLLTHTSGIPDYFDEEEMDDYEDLWRDYPVYQIETLKDFLPLFQKEQMKFNPGQRFHYNNAGYIILGLILEQQTGRTFTEYIEAEVFQKCGMSDSGYFVMDRLPENTAIGYIDNEEEQTWRTNIFSIPKKGGSDGGAYTTAYDIMKLWEALFNFELLSEDMTKQLLLPRVQVNGEVHYGYGIWMNQRENHIYKYHLMGYDPGVSFRTSVYPDIRMKMVIPSNVESGPFEITKVIEGTVLNT